MSWPRLVLGSIWWQSWCLLTNGWTIHPGGHLFSDGFGFLLDELITNSPFFSFSQSLLASKPRSHRIARVGHDNAPTSAHRSRRIEQASTAPVRVRQMWLSLQLLLPTPMPCLYTGSPLYLKAVTSLKRTVSPHSATLPVYFRPLNISKEGDPLITLYLTIAKLHDGTPGIAVHVSRCTFFCKGSQGVG